MKVAGSYTLHAPADQVWPLIHDPAALVGLIPGCDRLEPISPSEYRGQMQIPVAAVAGVYTICVRLQESAEPFVTRLSGEIAGATGTIQGDAWFRLTVGADPATAVLTYEGQGMIAGPLSQIDGRLADSLVRSLLQRGLADLDRRLQAEASS